MRCPNFAETKHLEKKGYFKERKGGRRSSTQPASPSHHQPQLSLGQHPSRGRGIFGNGL
jgi:hypothetical protein